MRTEEQKTEMGNRVSAMFAALPVEIDDPVERLLSVHRSTIGAKQMHEDIGGNTLQEWADLASPALFSRRCACTRACAWPTATARCTTS